MVELHLVPLTGDHDLVIIDIPDNPHRLFRNISDIRRSLGNDTAGWLQGSWSRSPGRLSVQVGSSQSAFAWKCSSARKHARIYAGAVDEYWVVDLERQELVVHRDDASGQYLRVDRVARGGQAKPTALAMAPLDTDALFATVLGERG